MQHIKVCLILAAALFLASTVPPASAEPPKSIVLVHGAWVDASAWKPVYEILTAEGFRVSMVQEPETSFAADVTAAKRVLDLQDGPTLLVGHSYGGSSITEAGVHPIVVGFVFVAAHAPDVGEDEGTLGKKPSRVLAKTEGAIKKGGQLHLSRPGAVSQAVCARSAARAGGICSAVSGPARGRGLQHATNGSCLEDEAELGSRRGERQDHQSGYRTLLLRESPESYNRDQRCQPLRVRISSE
jgi:pimeloyl-ACP methyl ester carboxylesterase